MLLGLGFGEVTCLDLRCEVGLNLFDPVNVFLFLFTQHTDRESQLLFLLVPHRRLFFGRAPRYFKLRDSCF